MILGQQHGAGVKIGTRCIWDAEADTYAYDSYVNVRKRYNLIFDTCHMCFRYILFILSYCDHHELIACCFFLGHYILRGHSICDLFLLTFYKIKHI